jgi:CDGSH-type Zn-finger protein
MTRITVNNHGSVRIEGDFEVCDSEGRQFDLSGRTTVSLCRCGSSENKPFCDGSHRRIGFQSEVKARQLPPPPPRPPAAGSA